MRSFPTAHSTGFTSHDAAPAPTDDAHGHEHGQQIRNATHPAHASARPRTASAHARDAATYRPAAIDGAISRHGRRDARSAATSTCPGTGATAQPRSTGGRDACRDVSDAHGRADHLADFPETKGTKGARPASTASAMSDEIELLLKNVRADLDDILIGLDTEIGGWKTDPKKLTVDIICAAIRKIDAKMPRS